MKNILLKGLFISTTIILTTSSVSALTCTNLTKTLSKGSENSEVLSLQQFLFDKGYLVVKPNGYFGSGTVSAVKKFQGASGLLQAGSVGPATRGKVKEISCVGAVDTSNFKRLDDVKTILGVIVQWGMDHTGSYPSGITEIPKEICMTNALSCKGLVDLSVVTPVYIVKLPTEIGKTNPNGIGYKVSKSGSIVTVTAQYQEGSQIIKASGASKQP